MLRLNLWRANSCLHAWPMTAWLWSSVITQTCFFQKPLCDLLTSQQSSCESSIMFKHWYEVYQCLLKCQPSNKGWGAVRTQSITGVTLNSITRIFTTQDPVFMFFLGLLVIFIDRDRKLLGKEKEWNQEMSHPRSEQVLPAQEEHVHYSL